MIFAWYHWAIFGVVLTLSELLIPTLVLIWFGLGALIIAAIVVMIPNLELIAQLLIWGVVSIGFVVLWFRVFKPYHHKTLVGRSSAQVIGEVGLLVNDVDAFQKGKVRFQTPVVGSDIWDCVADQPIKAGNRVKVLSIEGTLVRVKPTETSS
jgi:membrane protein implicated in regulation of membrane protease activity